MTSGGTSAYLKFMGVVTPRGLLPPAVSCQVVKYLTVTSRAFTGTDTPRYVIHGWGSARKGNARAIRHTVNMALEEMYPDGQIHKGFDSLRQKPFLLTLRLWGRFTSPAAKSEEKRLFLQTLKTLVYWTTLGYWETERTVSDKCVLVFWGFPCCLSVGRESTLPSIG